MNLGSVSLDQLKVLVSVESQAVFLLQLSNWAGCSLLSASPFRLSSERKVSSFSIALRVCRN